MEINNKNIEIIEAHIRAIESTLDEYSELELDAGELVDFYYRKNKLKEIKKLLDEYRNAAK